MILLILVVLSIGLGVLICQSFDIKKDTRVIMLSCHHTTEVLSEISFKIDAMHINLLDVQAKVKDRESMRSPQSPFLKTRGTKGIKRTPEQRAKASQAAKIRWEKKRAAEKVHPLQMIT